jgi:acetyl-CoA carboxylase biotin carboxyl carrier protein
MPAQQPFDKEFIKELAKMLADCDLTEIEIEHDKSRLRVAREIKQTVYAPVHSAPISAMPPQMQAVPQQSTQQTIQQAKSSKTVANETGHKVTSPMVGTIYTSPEPGAGPFVTVGSRVEEGQTIMIVEAMKVMNNIPSPKSGTVKAIKVSDKEPVEYNQVLMIIE